MFSIDKKGFLCHIIWTGWLSTEQIGYGKNRIPIDRKDWQSKEQNSYIFVIHHNIAWQIMTYHNILSWKWKISFFVAKTGSYDIFVAKIYDYMLIKSFWGSAGFLDSLTSYATLFMTSLKTDQTNAQVRWLLPHWGQQGWQVRSSKGPGTAYREEWTRRHCKSLLVAVYFSHL